VGRAAPASTGDENAIEIDLMTRIRLLSRVAVGILLEATSDPLLADNYDVALANYTNTCNEVLMFSQGRPNQAEGSYEQWVTEKVTFASVQKLIRHRQSLYVVVMSSSPPRRVPEWVIKLQDKVAPLLENVVDPGPPPNPNPYNPIIIRTKSKRTLPVEGSICAIEEIGDDGVARRWLESDGAEHRLELPVLPGVSIAGPSGTPDVTNAPTMSLDEQVNSLRVVLKEMSKGPGASLDSLTNVFSAQALLFLAEEGLPKDATYKSDLIDALRSYQGRQMLSKGFDPLKGSDLRKFSATYDFRSGLRVKSDALKRAGGAAAPVTAPKGR
jgi:hypothetical protein